MWSAAKLDVRLSGTKLLMVFTEGKNSTSIFWHLECDCTDILIHIFLHIQNKFDKHMCIKMAGDFQKFTKLLNKNMFF